MNERGESEKKHYDKCSERVCVALRGVTAMAGWIFCLSGCLLDDTLGYLVAG